MSKDLQLLFQRLSFVATGGQSDIIAARKKSLVYTNASLKVWIRYDIRDSAGRLQQGLHLYSLNVSLLLLELLSTTASGFTTKYSCGEVLRSRQKNWAGNWYMEDS